METVTKLSLIEYSAAQELLYNSNANIPHSHLIFKQTLLQRSLKKEDTISNNIFMCINVSHRLSYFAQDIMRG